MMNLTLSRKILATVLLLTGSVVMTAQAQQSQATQTTTKSTTSSKSTATKKKASLRAQLGSTGSKGSSTYTPSANSQKLATVNSSSYRAVTKTKTAETKSPISGSIEISRSSSLYDLKNGEKYDGMDYSAGLSYSFDFGAVSTRLGYSQNMNDSESSALNDSNISYSHKAQVISDDPQSMKVTWAPSGTIIIPISERSRDVEQLQTAVIGSLGLKMFAGEQTAVHGLGASFSLSAGKNFHRFETDKDGTILNSTSSNQSIAVFYSLGDWAFTVSYANRIRWPYSGDVRQSFELAQDISYSFLQGFTASLGHTNSGASLRPNGQDSNVSLVDDDNSIIYLSLGYGF